MQHHLHIVVDEELYLALRRIADAEALTWGQLLRKAVLLCSAAKERKESVANKSRRGPRKGGNGA